MESIIVNPKESIEDREFIQHLELRSPSSFKPRAKDWMARYPGRPQVNLASMEVKRLMRSWPDEGNGGFPLLEYQLWVEAGKHAVPIDGLRPDQNYNGNIWRNFREFYGLNSSQSSARQTVESRIDDSLATIYPLNVPKPSQMGSHGYRRYVAESRLFPNIKYRNLVLQQLRKDDHTMREMKLFTEARNPPLDTQGHILPPEGYKKYPSLVPPIGPTSLAEDSSSDLETDMFGNLVRKRHEPRLWKLGYKSNNPQYQSAMEYAREVSCAPRINPATAVIRS